MSAYGARGRTAILETTYRVPVTERDRVRAGLVQQLIALCSGLPVEDIRSPGRLGLKGCRARWTALYLARVGYGWPLERVSHVFGVNRATAGNACRWVEDERDRPELDAMLDRLEALISTLFEAPLCDLPR